MSTNHGTQRNICYETNITKCVNTFLTVVKNCNYIHIVIR